FALPAKDLLARLEREGIASAVLGAPRVAEEREAIEELSATTGSADRELELLRMEDDDRRSRRVLAERRGSVAVDADADLLDLDRRALLAGERGQRLRRLD